VNRERFATPLEPLPRGRALVRLGLALKTALRRYGLRLGGGPNRDRRVSYARGRTM
jgi:hypothetical protein